MPGLQFKASCTSVLLGHPLPDDPSLQSRPPPPSPRAGGACRRRRAQRPAVGCGLRAPCRCAWGDADGSGAVRGVTQIGSVAWSVAWSVLGSGVACGSSVAGVLRPVPSWPFRVSFPFPSAPALPPAYLCLSHSSWGDCRPGPGVACQWLRVVSGRPSHACRVRLGPAAERARASSSLTQGLLSGLACEAERKTESKRENWR